MGRRGIATSGIERILVGFWRGSMSIWVKCGKGGRRGRGRLGRRVPSLSLARGSHFLRRRQSHRRRLLRGQQMCREGNRPGLIVRTLGCSHRRRWCLSQHKGLLRQYNHLRLQPQMCQPRLKPLPPRLLGRPKHLRLRSDQRGQTQDHQPRNAQGTWRGRDRNKGQCKLTRQIQRAQSHRVITP